MFFTRAHESTTFFASRKSLILAGKVALPRKTGMRGTRRANPAG
jgi:hypothetical protein